MNKLMEGPIVEPVVIITGSVEAEDVVMRFKDGYKNIPEAIVAHLGGTEAVKKMKGLQQVNYASWSKAFWSKVEQNGLNSLQQTIIGSHFGQR